MRLTKLAFFISIVLVISGCGSDEGGNDGSSQVNIATAGTAGIYYALGNGIANVWSDEVEGMKASAQSSAGSPQNINYINVGEANVAFSQNGIALQAWEGTGPFEEPIQNIRALTYLYPNLAYFVVGEDEGINDFSGLEGKVLAPGSVGSGTEQNAREILDLAGISYEDGGNADVQYLDNAESASQFTDGKVDMVYIAGGLGHASMMEMSNSRDIKILPVDGSLRESVLEEYPWYFEYTIPAESYKGQPSEVETVAVGNMLISSEDLDDEAVYNMLETLYGNIDQLKNNYQGIADLKVEDGLNGVTIPLHPGAVQFFEDNDIEVPDELKPE
ncbi:TAXI family TRAP transporter solute-binding subunit [Oceanobacillus halotolerans]|uniref:TAXI family TRAP transporter solute-binding subunit n=1 Tax=Oceanobacillus halotolerans TaxID=2663380 RepID=UPI0013DADCAB|nr:TAXI family TRAP transporter solute-binding subunit [Oceanobacillus halotolerans]